jgi:hypothetical protein
MPWNGSGTFNRIFSWVADKAAGLDISSSRMDTDTNDIAAQGFGNCLTRDGQGQPTANLPMAGFRHTGVQNAVNRTDYSSLGQLQDGLVDWTVAGGTSDALTATYTPAITGLSDGQICYVRATAQNLTATPTFSPNGLTPHVITTLGGGALAAGATGGSINGAGYECVLRYNSAGTRWELLNPSILPLANVVGAGVPSTGDIKLTLKTVADSGWLLFDDGTFGSATSGSSNSNSALNQALFNILFAAPFTDATCPLLTSTGAGTTRAAQGSAAAAWAANCRMSLPKMLGRALALAGSGSGLTPRTMGQTTGAESHSLTAGEIPSLTSVNAAQSVTVNVPGSGSNRVPYSSNGDLSTFSASATGANVSVYSPANNWAYFTSLTGSNSISASYTNGSQTAVSLMQPSSFLNAMVKQ